MLAWLQRRGIDLNITPYAEEFTDRAGRPSTRWRSDAEGLKKGRKQQWAKIDYSSDEFWAKQRRNEHADQTLRERGDRGEDAFHMERPARIQRLLER
jgi:hypothetical protein